MGNCWGSHHHHAADLNPSTITPDSACPSQFSERVSGETLPAPNLKNYSFSELKKATGNFKSDMALGVGSFGKVYKGWVDENSLAPSEKFGSGMMVAIKKHSHESVEGFYESEVNFLATLSHPNLIKLLGYCREEKERLLVYEFMQNESLDNHLFSESSDVEPLSWNIRLKVAICVARGLAFLHASENQVIHRDFKPSNILLDGNYNAKIANFGLAKLGPSGGDTHVSTRVLGTYGYAAPEYIARGHLYLKSDVYGFGVVSLELLTGRRAIDAERPNGQQNLIDWAKSYLSHKRKLKSIVDMQIKGQYSSKVMWQFAQLILKCLEMNHRNRPSMKEALEELERIEAIKENQKSSGSCGYRETRYNSIIPSYFCSRVRVVVAP